jgi:hypothetical protein
VIALESRIVTRAILIADFLRAQARWRLNSAGDSPIRVGRCVVSLLDAAAYMAEVPEDDPSLIALARAGCFSGGAFDPGDKGLALVRSWQLADKQSAGPDELLPALAAAAAPRAAAALRAVPIASVPRQAAAAQFGSNGRHPQTI